MEAIIGAVVGFVVGAASQNVVSGIVSGTGSVLRGVTKELIKGGIMIQENVSSMCSGSGGFMSDLVAEARQELAGSSGSETVPASAEAAK